MFKVNYINRTFKKYCVRNIYKTFQKYVFNNIYLETYSRNIFSSMFDWYQKYILSKYCKSGISQGKKNKRKFVRGNPYKIKVLVHMRTPKLFEVYASAYAKTEAFIESWTPPPLPTPSY